MAILGAYPVMTQPDQPVDLETRILGFQSLDGTVLMPCQGREFVGRNGMEGLDLPPLERVTDRVPGQPGDRLLSKRWASRDITIPLWLRSDDGHRDFLDKRQQLIGLFDFDGVDYADEGGTFDLVANSLDGNRERRLRVDYVSGMEGNMTRETDRKTWQMLPLRLAAVRPFWEGEVWSTPEIRKPAGKNFFARFPPRLSNDRALGADLTITVPGTARSWPQVNVVGPSSGVQVTGPGLYVSVPGGLDDGEVLVLETDPERRRDETTFDGDPDWSRVSPNCVFGAGLRPGPNTFTIDVGTASASTVAYVAGVTRWLTPW